MQILGTHHVAILTRDPERLAAFYTGKLGFAVTRRWDDMGIVFLDAGDVQIELERQADPDDDAHPPGLGRDVGLNHIALRVADVDRAFRELRELGVAVLSAPEEYRSLRVAFLADPEGNVLELVQEPRGR